MCRVNVSMLAVLLLVLSVALSAEARKEVLSDGTEIKTSSLPESALQGRHDTADLLGDLDTMKHHGSVIKRRFTTRETAAEGVKSLGKFMEQPYVRNTHHHSSPSFLSSNPLSWTPYCLLTSTDSLIL